MKRIHFIFIIVMILIILIAYAKSFDILGNNVKTVVDSPVSITLSERPRLEDDFYDYVNFEYLSENNLGDELYDYYTNATEKIEEEKNDIIDELIEKNDSIGIKMNTLYNLYMQNNEQASLEVLNKYIDRIKDSKNIEEYFKNVIDINYELSTDILISPNVLFNFKGESKKYFGLDFITYDWNNISGYYSISGYEEIVRMYKKYDIRLLKQYGYSSEEASKITDEVQKMYKQFSLFSVLSEDDLLNNGYKVYKLDELQAILKNLNLHDIIKYYSDFYDSSDGILVLDLNQLKMVDSYLKEENLDTLKSYATLKILTSYSEYISDDFSGIYKDYLCESQNYIKTEEETKKDIIYSGLYSYFKDTITEEFANRHFTNEQKVFYTNLVKEEIEAYKKRIMQEDWLSDETKEKALEKMEKMTYTIGIPENFVKVENEYKIDKDKAFIENIINIKQNVKKEEMNQYKKGNITYNVDDFDQLTFNAFYLSNNNSINLLLGYIYSLTESLELGDTNFEESYYKILGSIGATVGHELSHALDTIGSKYDENGNYINWWTEDDSYNFTTLTSKVVRYYEEFEQFGNTTIGENIADLGGMSIVLKIAEEKGANAEDYKTIFESYAMDWASQHTSIEREWRLKNDEHSPDENRVNAVLSALDKFYEVYNIKSTDKMYVSEDKRVSVW